MAPIISIHEYVLKPEVDPAKFERDVSDARTKGLLVLPGLQGFYLLKGIRGARQDAYAAVWIFSSREAWEQLWGPVGQPKEKAEYPQNWKVWEDRVLAPYLAEDPDQIRFTAYQAW